MKRFLFLFAVVSTLALFTVSCEDSGDIGDYVPPTVAVGVDSSYKPDIIAVVPGYNQAEVIWDLNSEGRTIERSYIYWVNTQTGAEGAYEATISAESLDATGYYRQTFDIPEGNYTFYIRNLDSDKYISASSLTLENTIYGAVTESELSARPIESLNYSDTNSIYVLTWGECDDCVGSSVTYTRTNGDIYTLDGGTNATLTMYSATKEDMITVTSQHIPYRAVYKDGLDAEVLAALNIVNKGLDEIELSAVRRFYGNDTKFAQVSSIDELWTLINGWEDYRTDAQIEAGDATVTFANSTEAGRIDNLARKSNYNVSMKAGTYYIDAADMLTAANSGTGYNDSGVYHPSFTPVSGTTIQSVFIITGDNNYFDFTGVTIEIDTEALASFGGAPCGIVVYGNFNTLKGLTYKNTGSVYNIPAGACQSMRLCGRYNLVEDFNLEVRGSKPYGYGELFGKGSNNVIGHVKHSSFLVGGDYQTLRRCTIYSESYGHLIFMQAARNTTIEDTLIEGVMSTTDKVLEERGFGTSADLVNFMTYFGYTTPAGYPLPLQEDGYRNYSGGSTYFRNDGYTNVAGTTLGTDLGFTSLTIGVAGTSLKNCTAICPRSGTSFTNGGLPTIENVTLRGCGQGFELYDGTAMGSEAQPNRADCKYGRALGNWYDSSKNYDVHVELIPYEGSHYNTSGSAVYIKGNGHKIRLYEGDGLFYEDGLWVKLGGFSLALGDLDQKVPAPCYNNQVWNYTYYPVRMGWYSKYSTNGTNRTANTIYVKTKLPDGSTTDSQGRTYVFPIEVDDINGNLLTVGSDEYKSVLTSTENKIYSADTGEQINSVYQNLALGYEWDDMSNW